MKDERLRPETVIQVYVKHFYTDTGEPYYTPFDDFVEWRRYSSNIVYTVDETEGGRLVVYDARQDLAGETLAVMVTGTSDEQDGT